MLEDRFAKYHPSSYQEWIDIPGLSHIYRSLESQQSLKCWNLKTFRMKKCLEDTNIKSTIQTFDLACLPEGEQNFSEQLSWVILKWVNMMYWYDTLQIQLRWTPYIHMDIFVFSWLSFFIKDESFTKICIRVLLWCSCKPQERRSNQILGFVNLL